MAVTGDFFTIEGVAEVAEEGQRAFNLLMAAKELDVDNLVQLTIDHLNKKIAELKKLEEDFKFTFACSSLEEFERRVSKYYSYYNLSTFTGKGLKLIVDDFKAQLDANTLERQRRFDQLFQAFLNGYVQGPLTKEWMAALQGEEVSQAVVAEIISEFIHMINTLKGGGGLQFEAQTRHFSTRASDTKAALTLVANRGTDAFKKYLDEIYEKAINGVQLNYTNLKGGQSTIQFTSNIQASQHQVTATFGVKWADIIRSSGTKMLTKTELEEKLKRGEITEADITNKNQQIIDLICEELHVSGIYETYVRKKIQTMLGTDNYMFFVGNSFTNLEGILGEINAAIAISDLLGESYAQKALNWIGSQSGSTSGKQPSIDIVVNNILGGAEKTQFGMQVKNTMDEMLPDVSHDINFANKDLSFILEQAGIKSDAIESVYFSDTFNVPYKREGRLYTQVSYNTSFEHHDFVTKALFDEYIRIDKLIDEIVASINTYLARFASDFIYMQNPDFEKHLAQLDNAVINTPTTGNFCYIVGSKVYFASKMLEQLTKQLEALQSLQKEAQRADLQFKTEFSKIGEKGGSDFNIIAALNKNAHLSDYTLKMRSSWTFHG